MRKSRWLMAAAGALLVATIGVGAVMAQSAEDGTGVTFLDRLSERLGIQRSELDAAIKDVRTDQIDEAVANGKLTEEQAEQLKERLDNLPSAAPFFFRGPGRGLRGHDWFGFGLGPCISVGQEFADFLGTELAQLRTELQADGATLATVAEAHGKSRDELKAFIREEAQARLDEAVANGRLTQERADEAFQKLTDNLDALIDRDMPAFKPFGPRHGPGDGGARSDSNFDGFPRF